MTSQATEKMQRRTIEFTVHSKDRAPQGARNLLAAAEEKFGFIPNVLPNLAESPSVLQARLRMSSSGKTPLAPGAEVVNDIQTVF